MNKLTFIIFTFFLTVTSLDAFASRQPTIDAFAPRQPTIEMRIEALAKTANQQPEKAVTEAIKDLKSLDESNSLNFYNRYTVPELLKMILDTKNLKIYEAVFALKAFWPNKNIPTVNKIPLGYLLSLLDRGTSSSQREIIIAGIKLLLAHPQIKLSDIQLDGTLERFERHSIEESITSYLQNESIDPSLKLLKLAIQHKDKTALKRMLSHPKTTPLMIKEALTHATLKKRLLMIPTILKEMKKRAIDTPISEKMKGAQQ